jgi:hypothetical protein
MGRWRPGRLLAATGPAGRITVGRITVGARGMIRDEQPWDAPRFFLRVDPPSQHRSNYRTPEASPLLPTDPHATQEPAGSARPSTARGTIRVGRTGE